MKGSCRTGAAGPFRFQESAPHCLPSTIAAMIIAKIAAHTAGRIRLSVHAVRQHQNRQDQGDRRGCHGIEPFVYSDRCRDPSSRLYKLYLCSAYSQNDSDHGAAENISPDLKIVFFQINLRTK
jgi:hypothetical protein